jgi:hypothetical protein
MTGSVTETSLDHVRSLTEGRCNLCHAEPNFTDGQSHNTGISVGSCDAGRFGVTRIEADRGAFGGRRFLRHRRAPRSWPAPHQTSALSAQEKRDRRALKQQIDHDAGRTGALMTLPFFITNATLFNTFTS